MRARHFALPARGLPSGKFRNGGGGSPRPLDPEPKRTALGRPRGFGFLELPPTGPTRSRMVHFAKLANFPVGFCNLTKFIFCPGVYPANPFTERIYPRNYQTIKPTSFCYNPHAHYPSLLPGFMHNIFMIRSASVNSLFLPSAFPRESGTFLRVQGILPRPPKHLPRFPTKGPGNQRNIQKKFFLIYIFQYVRRGINIKIFLLYSRRTGICIYQPSACIYRQKISKGQ